MRRSGGTKAGAQRRRRRSRGASTTHRADGSAKRLKALLKWLLGKPSVSEAATRSKDAFRRRAERPWKMRPLSECAGEARDAVFAGGIHAAEKPVVLIACGKDRVLAWRLAESECLAARAALMPKAPAPTTAVTDGGGGLGKAARVIRPAERIRRRLVRASGRTRRRTAPDPKPDAGEGPLEPARGPTKANDADGAARWLAGHASWCSRRERFLRELALEGGKRPYAHERPRSARRPLSGLAEEGALLAFAELQESLGGRRPSADNAIEGRVNARMRETPRAHRGLSTTRRVKAVLWRRYMNSELETSEAEMLKTVKTGEEVKGLFASASKPRRREDGAPDEHGGAPPEWGEMKMSGSSSTGWF